MGNISKTLLIDISVKTSNVENIQVRVDCTPEEIASFTCLFKEFRDVFAWSYKEIPRIDNYIIEHEIKVYENPRSIRQIVGQIYPRKPAAIKAEVEKLLCVCFIYPVPLT